MTTKVELFNKQQLKTDLLDIRPGDTVRVHQIIKEPSKKSGKEIKERIQVFEGIVIARKHGKGISATITVRKVISGIGVEKIFPLHSPSIAKIEVIKRGKVRRAKLYYLRTAKGRKARLKNKEFIESVAISDSSDNQIEDKSISMENSDEVSVNKEAEEKKEEKVLEEK
jgi:large subunit ribosomal protein L19